ncbi:hypothetical protein [Lacticaseibacillus sharpeae]|uniref:hypothetical protein n=1 Tax=Lacticaseibacillus sharpeae TaxID=1626 RepID=UPI0012E24BB4|nr:hypothetical protein [Lacticaseibacillus sharpeae]
MNEQAMNRLENSQPMVQISPNQTDKIWFIYRDDCPDCQKIFREVYALRKVDNITFVNTNNAENRRQALQLGVTRVPGFVVHGRLFTTLEQAEKEVR